MRQKKKEKRKRHMCEKQTEQKTPLDHIRLVGKYALNHFFFGVYIFISQFNDI